MKFFVTLLLFAASFATFAKNDTIIQPQPRMSALALTTFKKSNQEYIKVIYGQPLKKGRKIFGSLVPYDKVWRTGANEATEITFANNIRIGEIDIKAGTYSIFTVPHQETWTFMLNSELGQWGDYKYDETKNLVKMELPVQKNTDVYEGFTVKFDQTPTGALLTMLWDDVSVNLPIQFIQAVQEEGKKKKKKK